MLLNSFLQEAHVHDWSLSGEPRGKDKDSDKAKSESAFGGKCQPQRLASRPTMIAATICPMRRGNSSIKAWLNDPCDEVAGNVGRICLSL
jgi:hypothetical protein|tara:strand:+ start:6711 stop:6980 length:270 start_codon:yes stop_codon:yes gene_type:complete